MRSEKDDVPVIGDYSNAQDARLRAEPRREPRRSPEPQSRPAPQGTRPARPHTEQLRIDPSDVRRHARLRRESQRPGPLTKLLRYGAIALVLAALIAGYWNFDTLRGMRLDLSTWTSLFAVGPKAEGGATVETGEAEIASTAVKTVVELPA